MATDAPFRRWALAALVLCAAFAAPGPVPAQEVPAQWLPFQRLAGREVPDWSAADLAAPAKGAPFDVKPAWSAPATGSESPAKAKPAAGPQATPGKLDLRRQRVAAVIMGRNFEGKTDDGPVAGPRPSSPSPPSGTVRRQRKPVGITPGSGNATITDSEGGTTNRPGLRQTEPEGGTTDQIEQKVLRPEGAAADQLLSDSFEGLDALKSQPQTVFIEHEEPGPIGLVDAFACTGVLIGRNRVLTAAHCVCRCGMRIGYGSDARDKTAVRVDVREAIIHPSYNTPSWRGHDLAVLVLPEHIPPDFVRAVQPAQILSARGFALGRYAQLNVIGYGLTNPNDRNSWGDRLFGRIRVASALCIEEWATQGRCASFQEFVLSNSLGDRPGSSNIQRDTCAGDSGGPAFVAAPGPRILVGVTSRGFPAPGEASCGQGGIYGIPGTLPNLRWLRTIVPDLQVAAEPEVEVLFRPPVSQAAAVQPAD